MIYTSSRKIPVRCPTKSLWSLARTTAAGEAQPLRVVLSFAPGWLGGRRGKLARERGDCDQPIPELLAGGPALRERFGWRISPYVLPRERVEARHREGDPLIQTIAEEGRVLLGDPLQEVASAR